jgi:hypothetical protein
MFNRFRTLFLASALIAGGSVAWAQSAADAAVAGLLADGFTRVEVKSGPTQTKIEGVRGTETRELVIDNASGNVVKSETGTVGLFDNTNPGVFVRSRDSDFVRDGARGDDDDGEHRGRGRGSDDDDDDDDDRGRGRGSDDDDDHDDDHGGRGGDDDDDHDDDHGGDDDSDDDDDDD